MGCQDRSGCLIRFRSHRGLIPISDNSVGSDQPICIRTILDIVSGQTRSVFRGTAQAANLHVDRAGSTPNTSDVNLHEIGLTAYITVLSSRPILRLPMITAFDYLAVSTSPILTFSCRRLRCLQISSDNAFHSALQRTLRQKTHHSPKPLDACLGDIAQSPESEPFSKSWVWRPPARQPRGGLQCPLASLPFQKSWEAILPR